MSARVEGRELETLFVSVAVVLYIEGEVLLDVEPLQLLSLRLQLYPLNWLMLSGFKNVK